MDKVSRFLGVGDDGKVGALSGWHALSAGVVFLAGAVWFHHWLMVPLMALVVLRAVIALWLARKANRPQARTPGDRADAHMHSDS
jgi:hypothetical protein